MLKSILIIVLFGYSSFAFSATFTSVITGDWDDGATWGNTSPGVSGVDYPSAIDNATIISGTNVSLTGDETIVNLIVNSGGILDAFTNKMIITINGTLLVDGTLKTDTKEIIFTGGVGTTIDGIGTIYIKGGKTFEVHGNTSVLITADLYFLGKIEIQNDIVVTNNGIVTVDKDIKGTNGNSEWVNAANSTVALRKKLMDTGKLTANANGNTVVYYGDDQDIKTPEISTYYNLTLTGKASKKKKQKADLIILNDLLLEGSEFQCNDFRINIGGHWTNTGGSFTEAIGVVEFDGGDAQTISTYAVETFYDWELSGGGTVTISTSDIIVSNTMTMTSGNINAESQKITLGTDPVITGTLTHVSGTIIGYFERWLSTTTAVTYLLPVGTASNYRPANITFNTIGNNGSIITRFVASGPGNNGLSLVDGATTVYNAFVDGYWEITTANSFAASDFDLDCTGNGFIGFTIDANTRLLTRANGASAWIADGTHVPAVGNTASRTSITTISGHYCFGSDVNCTPPATPTVTSADLTPCSSTSGTYSVTNNVGSTYSWSISPAGAGAFNPVPAAGDFSVTIDWGASGTVANVICIESNACTSTDPDSLSIDVLSIAPSSMTGRTSVAKATLGEPYSITGLAGYTYAWVITDGSVATGQGTPSITVDWDNTVGTGQVSVVATSGGGCASAAAFDMAVKRYEVITSNGTSGGDWNTATTWDCVCVPLMTDNVRILTNDTVSQGNYNIKINHLIIEINGVLERVTDNKDISVTGDLILNGKIDLGAGNKKLKLEGVSTIIDGGGTVNITAAGIVEIKTGHKTISSTATITISGGNVDIRDAGIIITNNGSITITNDILNKDASNNWINATNSTLNLGGDFDDIGVLTASATGNTVNYNGTIAQNIVVPAASTYYNLSVSTLDTKTIQGALDINGDLLIEGSAQLDPADLTFTLAGDWTNTSLNADPFVEGNTTGSVTFDGTALQTITATAGETFNLMTVLNTSTGVILAATSDITIGNILTLTDGELDSRTNSALVIIQNGTTVAGTSNASYVKGFVRKIGNVAFEFPVGDGGEYAPSSISAPALVTDAFDSEYYYIGPHNSGYDTTLHPPSINHLSENEYWFVNRTIGASNVFVTLSWDSPRSGGVTILPDMAVARWDGAAWVDHSNGGTTGNTTAGTVTSLAAVTSFSPFTLGSSTFANPLPIEIVTFNAVLNEDAVEITWTTATEINNDYFTIEKSKDTKDWEKVAEVSGAGTSTSLIDYFEIDYRPIEGKSYYRLKQTDFNGAVTYSNIAPIDYIVDAGPEQTMLLYPNPNDGQNVNVKLSGFANKEVLIIVRDITGKEMYSKAIYSQHDGIVELVTLENKLPSGTYLITASSKQIFISKKLMVK